MQHPSVTQNIASDPRYNVILAASAGTGKTKVLTDRFIRLMLHNTPPQKILCLTFTNAAAAEMKQRILSTLCSWKHDAAAATTYLNSLEEYSAKNLRKAMRLYDSCLAVFAKLNITTIHSLCADIIKRFYSEQPSKIIQPYQEEHILSAVYTKLFDEWALSSNPHYLQLLDYFDTAQLQAHITQCLDGSWELPNKNQIDELHRSYDTVQQLLQWHQSFLHTIDWPKLMEQLSGQPIARTLYQWWTSQYDAVEKMLAYIDVFLTQARTPRRSLIKQALVKTRPDLLELLQRAAEHAEICWQRYANRTNADLHYALLALAKETAHHFAQTKENLCCQSFSDLISSAISLLQRSPQAPSILYALDYQMDHLLVDEAQDNSPQQWLLLRQLTHEFFSGMGARTVERTIFIVGDAKQSIYSFQGASPDLFIKMCKWFAMQAQQAQQPVQWLDMQTSFRSTASILQLVNRTFAQTPLGHDEITVHHQAKRAGDGLIAIWPLITQPKSEAKGWILPSVDQPNKPHEELALFIANKIHGWLSNGRTLAGHGRIIKAGDIMILLRKRSDLILALQRQLQLLQIPVLECGKSLLRDHLLCRDLISLLRFISDVEDDLNLAGLLRSPFFGISEDDLFRYCYKRPGSLFAQLGQLNQLLHEKLQEILASKHDRSILGFLLHVLYKLDYLPNLQQYFGYQAKVIIPYLLDIIADYESEPAAYFTSDISKETANYDVLVFLDWFANANIELQINSDDISSAVKIMTVHAAKGLQAPVVILADAASSENAPHHSVLWHEGIPFFTFNRLYDSQIVRQIREKYETQQTLESNRLLYVGLTRAEDELYIAGIDNRGVEGSWYSTVSAHLK